MIGRIQFIIFAVLIPLLCNATADTANIKAHLIAITKTPSYRNERNPDQLLKVAAYIQSIFSRYADSVLIQEYQVNGQPFQNVIASFGINNTQRVIIGAHYDVCGEQEGADDNASGVVGLLELARLLYQRELTYRIDLVAFTLEEPPHFRKPSMGSYIHAKSLADSNIRVEGMIALEMIGYFDDARKSQRYPVGILKLFYGSKGNYITLVRKFGAGKFARKFCRSFKAINLVRTKKFKGPASLPGIDFSDHLNYWKFGFSALMITDTAFYRNTNYHTAGDTLETLDLVKMAKVIDNLYEALVRLNL